jgi:excisionase family DNA binding protein
MTRSLLMTIEETAVVLGVSKRVIYRWAAERRLPGLRRIGRALYVARPEVLAWLGIRDDEDVRDSGMSRGLTGPGGVSHD